MRPARGARWREQHKAPEMLPTSPLSVRERRAAPRAPNLLHLPAEYSVDGEEERELEVVDLRKPVFVRCHEQPRASVTQVPTVPVHAAENGSAHRHPLGDYHRTRGCERRETVRAAATCNGAC